MSEPDQEQQHEQQAKQEQQEQRRMSDAVDHYRDQIRDQKDEIKALRDEAASWRTKLREVESERDELQGKISEFETQVESLSTAKTELEGSLESAKKTADEILAERKTELIERIPEDKREKYTGLELDVLKTIIDDIAPIDVTPPSKTSTASEPPSGGGSQGAKRNLSEMSAEEVQELMQSDPKAFDESIGALTAPRNGFFG